MYMLLNICGYPEPNTKEFQALNELGITNIYRNYSLPSYLRNAHYSKEILMSVMSNSAEKRPSINRFLQHLSYNPEISMTASIASRQSSIPYRKRASSAANGLTLVSIALSSRSRSKSKDEFDRYSKRFEKISNLKQSNLPLHSIIE